MRTKAPDARVDKAHLAVSRGPLIFVSQRGRTTVRAIEGFFVGFFRSAPRITPSQPATKPTFPMKKPTVGETDKLRALTEDPELRALMEQCDAALPAELGPILEAFNEKADALYPDWRETVERSRRDGVYLRAMFINTLKEARARPDLTEFQQFQIKDLEAEFVTLFDIFSAASPDVAEHAFKLALAVQEMALIARFAPEEVLKFKLRALVEGGERGGKKSGEARRRENQPWASHATDLAKVICDKLPRPSNEDVAVEIVSRWKLETPPPGVRTLAAFMSELRKSGILPKRAK